MNSFHSNLHGLKIFFIKNIKLIVVIIITVEGLFITYNMIKPRIYRVSSSVKINNADDLKISQRILLTRKDKIETQAHDAVGYAMLLKVAKKLSFLSDTISEDIITRDEKNIAILNTLRSKITTTALPLTNTINFVVSSEIPKEAEEIANTLAFIFKEQSFKKKKINMKRTEMFLRKQCRIYEQSIDSIEKKIADLKIKDQNIYIDDKIVNIMNNYTDIIEKINDTELKISTITFQRSQLINRYYKRSDANKMKDIRGVTDSLLISNKIEWISGIIEGDKGLMDLNDRLLTLQIELSNNLVYYTPIHPKVKVIEKNIQKTIAEINKGLTFALEKQNERKSSLLTQKFKIEEQFKQFSSKKMEYIRFNRELDNKRRTYSLLYDKLQYAMIEQAGMVENVTINHLATLPEKPVTTDFGKAMASGVYFGIVIGIMVGILRDIIDPTIKNIDTMRLMFKPLLLAVIPRMGIENRRNDLKLHPVIYSSMHYHPALFVHFNPRHIITEAFKLLRENLELTHPSDKTRVILVSSATHKEGRSSTCINLSIAYAQSGRRVCLLECDFRNPSIERIFGIDQDEPGMSDIILGTVNWKDCIQSITDLILGSFSVDQVLSQPGLENLFIIPHGMRHFNPSMLLDSDKMPNVFDELKRSFDIILVDAPPFLPVADSLILCKYIDGVILVYRAGKTARNLLEGCIQRLEAINVPIYGIVMNDIDIHSSHELAKNIFKNSSDIL